MISTDTQKIAAQFRLSGWGEAVKERIASGQSISAFCKERGISKTTYYYRQKKVREAACVEIAKAQRSSGALVPSGWMPLTGLVAEPVTADSTLAIEVGGCNITANAGTDAELLVKVCRALKSL